MEIQYELTEEDVVAFNLYHVKNSKVGKNSLQWQRYISPLIFLLFAYFLSVFTDMARWTAICYIYGNGYCLGDRISEVFLLSHHKASSENVERGEE